MARKPARFGDLAQTDKPAPAPTPALAAAQAAEDEPTLPVPLPQKRAGKRAKKLIGGHFDPQSAKALAILAIERDTTQQALMAEAFNDLLRKYGRHPAF